MASETHEKTHHIEDIPTEFPPTAALVLLNEIWSEVTEEDFARSNTDALHCITKGEDKSPASVVEAMLRALYKLQADVFGTITNINRVARMMHTMHAQGSQRFNTGASIMALTAWRATKHYLRQNSMDDGTKVAKVYEAIQVNLKARGFLKRWPVKRVET